MAHYNKLFDVALFCLLVAGVLMITGTAGHPSPGEKSETKIRIHVPVKHHTHYHTKTVVKEVIKEVHPPPKKTKKPKEEHHHHHHVPKWSAPTAREALDLHEHSGPAPSAPALIKQYQHQHQQSNIAQQHQKRLSDLFDDADIAEDLGFTAEELDDLYPLKSGKSKKQRSSSNAKSPYYRR